MRVIRSVLVAILLLAGSMPMMAQTDAASGAPTGAGAWFGTFFWIGFTVLLLVAAVIIAYQAMVRPNRR